MRPATRKAADLAEKWDDEARQIDDNYGHTMPAGAEIHAAVLRTKADELRTAFNLPSRNR